MTTIPTIKKPTIFATAIFIIILVVNIYLLVVFLMNLDNVCVLDHVTMSGIQTYFIINILACFILVLLLISIYSSNYVKYQNQLEQSRNIMNRSLQRRPITLLQESKQPRTRPTTESGLWVSDDLFSYAPTPDSKAMNTIRTLRPATVAPSTVAPPPLPGTNQVIGEGKELQYLYGVSDLRYANSDLRYGADAPVISESNTGIYRI